MDDKSPRLSRLTSIITLLQSKSLITAPEIGRRFNISIRTVYRDIRALERSGIPVVTLDGKGYTLLDGYKLPPVMFTESEAFALITSEKIILHNKDSSLSRSFSAAVEKIKAVLKSSSKQKAEFLNKRVHIGKHHLESKTSHALMDMQMAMANFLLVKIKYQNSNGIVSDRLIEPFYIYHSKEENWTVHAYCHARKDFRTFRMDRMNKVNVLDQHFEPHKTTIQYYYGKKYYVPVHP